VSHTASIIISSDRAFHGTYVDQSGPAAQGWLKGQGYTVKGIQVVADDRVMMAEVVNAAVSQDTSLIVISGGTGLGPRDITPQTLDEICDYAIPGFGEMLRRESLKYSLNAYLSRCGGWVKNRSLIVALPGNPKAVVEQLSILNDLLPHALKAVAGICDNRRSTGVSP
jgi:molybdenum cofactor synthesis domain-containing protein